MIDFMKRHKIVGPSFFNDGSEVLTSELTKLLGPYCSREQIRCTDIQERREILMRKLQRIVW